MVSRQRRQEIIRNERERERGGEGERGGREGGRERGGERELILIIFHNDHLFFPCASLSQAIQMDVCSVFLRRRERDRERERERERDGGGVDDGGDNEPGNGED